MTARRIKGAILGTSILLALSVGTGAAALPQDSNRSDVLLIPVTDTPPFEVDIVNSLPKRTETPLPPVVQQKLGEIGSKSGSIDTAVWDDEQAVLTLYASGDILAVQTRAKLFLKGVTTRVVESLHTRVEVDQAIADLVVNPKSSDGLGYVAFAKPAPDGSYIEVGITGSGVSNFGGLRNSFDIPLRLVTTEPLLPSTRYRQTTPVFGGQYMDNTTNSCTTGFWVAKISTMAQSMLTADHCATSTGETWYYGSGGNTRTVGVSQGQAPGSSDLELYSAGSPSNITGHVMTGNYNNSNSVSPIRGYYNASVVGGSVCYSGSRTGLVCQNEVTYVNAAACYSPSQCYLGMTYTSQVNGTPAAGDGDSGGPVISVLSGGHVYASGLISGTVLGSPTCTGDPGSDAQNGRRCSAHAIFAPVHVFFNFNEGYGLYSVPF